MAKYALIRVVNYFVKSSPSWFFAIFLCSCNIAHSEQITGHATFTDGSALANVQLEFRVFSDGYQTDKSSTATVYYSNTDENGRFQWNSDVQLSGDILVVADSYKDGDSLGWHTIIRNFDSNVSTRLNPTFENRGRVIVRVFGQSTLPEDHTISLRCYATRHEQMIQIDRKIKPSDRGVTLDGLEPGEYRITAYIPKTGRESWETTVVVPESHPFRGICKVQLPVFDFGSLIAKFTMPDGRTPAAGLRMWVQAANGEASGVHAVTDQSGVLKLSDIVTGKVRIRLMDSPKIAPTSHWGNVSRSNQNPETSQHRLVGEEEVFSWIKGTIQYADRTPVPKVMCIGETQILNLSVTSMGDLDVNGACDENGNFSFRFEAGRRKLRFDIEGSNRLHGGFVITPPAFKVVLVDVNTQPGELVEKTIELPVCDRTVEIQWPLEKRDKESEANFWFGETRNVTLLFPLDADYCWCSSQPGVDFPENASDVRAWQRKFDSIPAGDGFAIFHKLGEQFDVMPFDSTTQSKLEFSPTRLGSLTIQAVEGETLREYTAKLYALVGGFEIPVAQRAADSKSPTNNTSPMPDSMQQMTLLGDQTIAIRGLGPGEYFLTLEKEQVRLEKQIRLSPAEETVVTLKQMELK